MLATRAGASLTPKLFFEKKKKRGVGGEGYE
jgi:hypothetical protein